MTRPTVLTRCVADHYANKQSERIIEVSDRETGHGCLISIRRVNDGRLCISINSADAGIYVLGPSNADSKRRVAQLEAQAKRARSRVA